MATQGLSRASSATVSAVNPYDGEKVWTNRPVEFGPITYSAPDSPATAPESVMTCMLIVRGLTPVYSAKRFISPSSRTLSPHTDRVRTRPRMMTITSAMMMSGVRLYSALNTRSIAFAPSFFDPTEPYVLSTNGPVTRYWVSRVAIELIISVVTMMLTFQKANSAPGIHPHTPPTTNATTSTMMMTRTLGSDEPLSAIPVSAPARAPTYSWPSPPMLKKPARKLTITAADRISSCTEWARSAPRPYGVVSGDKNSSAYAAPGSLPITAMMIAPITRAATTARIGWAALVKIILRMVLPVDLLGSASSVFVASGAGAAGAFFWRASGMPSPSRSVETSSAFSAWSALAAAIASSSTAWPPMARPTAISDLSLIHISEPTRRTPISYAVFCLKKKKKK